MGQNLSADSVSNSGWVGSKCSVMQALLVLKYKKRKIIDSGNQSGLGGPVKSFWNSRRNRLLALEAKVGQYLINLFVFFGSAAD